MPPDTYIHFILPRLRGDPTVTQFGMDTPTRLNVLECLQALLQGTKPSKLPVYLEDLVTVLTDPYVIDPESAVLPLAAVKVIVSVLEVSILLSSSIIFLLHSLIYICMYVCISTL